MTTPTSNLPPTQYPETIAIPQNHLKETDFFDQEIVINNWRGKLGQLVHSVFIVVSGFFRHVARTLFTRQPHTKGISEYYFTQQFNNSCHISPLMNMKLIEQLRKDNYEMRESQFCSRREWLGENQEMLMNWHKLMAKLSEPDASEKYPNLYSYLIRGQQEGPTSPYYFDSNGKFAFKGIKGIMEFSEMPFFLMDVDELQKMQFNVMCHKIDFGERIDKEDLGLKTGFVEDKGTYKVYNRQTKEFENISDLDWVTIESDNEDTVVKIHSEKLTESIRQNYSLPSGFEKYSIVMRKNKGLGFSKIGVIDKLGGGLHFPDKKTQEIHTYVPYQMSLLKFLLMTTGVDSDNNPIDNTHSLYPAFMELQKLMSEDTNNLWHKDNIDKEMLMQYQLAELFKKDKKLLLEAKATVDLILSSYGNYQKLCEGKFYDQDHHQLKVDNMKDYLLGDEQAIAYFFMGYIRMIWYSSINPKVVLNSMELGLPNNFSLLLHEHLKKAVMKGIQVKHEDKTSTTVSFISVWKKLQNSLQTNSKRQDFMSFDGHGWVLSFDPKLIKKQNNHPTIHDKQLLKLLGFAGVESWWGSELNLWYKKVSVQAN